MTRILHKNEVGIGFLVILYLFTEELFSSLGPFHHTRVEPGFGLLDPMLVITGRGVAICCNIIGACS
jgi:hypothetical protein